MKLQKYSCAALALLTSMFLASGCSLLPKEEEAIKPPLVKPAEQNYSTEVVEKADIRKEIQGNGVFESTETEQAQFTSQGGRVQKVHIKSGDTVKKGDLLLQLEVEGLDIQLLEQKLAVERSEYAWKQLKRDSAEAEQIRMAGLQLDIEKLKLEKLNRTVEKSELRAAMDGLVIFVEDLEKGDFVQPYQTLVTIANPNKLRFAYQASDSSNMREAEVGMKAEIARNDGSKTSGTVVQTPSTSPETTNPQLAEKYKNTLYVGVDKLPEGTEIGSSGSLTIILAESRNALVIPKSGLRSYLGRTFVRVLEGKALREVDVEIGLQSSTMVEIKLGLEEGQTIVLN